MRDSASGFVLRLLFRVACVLFAISLIRVALIGKPLSLSYFMELLSGLDLDFSMTIINCAQIADTFSGLGDFSFWEAILQFLRGILEVVALPVSLIVDLFSFASSVIDFCNKLLGFNLWFRGTS